MAKKHRASRNVVHCHCSCPYWGVAHDNVYVCRCDCGQIENICGYCLTAGRRNDCHHEEREARDVLEELAIDPEHVIIEEFEDEDD